MQISGELSQQKVIVKKPKDVGRLFNKSHFGKLTTKSHLELNLLEAVFLLGEGKINIYQKKKTLDFQNLVSITEKSIEDFDKKYLIFKDLRARGHAISLSKTKNITFEDFKKQFLVSTFSEKDTFDIDNIVKLINTVKKVSLELWFALVDEEGDITYYRVSLVELFGRNKQYSYSKSKAFLLKNRVIIFDRKTSKEMFDKEFFGKPFGEGLQLSIVEALFLLEKEYIEIFSKDKKKISKKNLENLQPDLSLRSIVFRDLKKQGLIVKTGFKFGTHFRAYSLKPDETHAEYLVHVIEKGFFSNWAEISRAVRLAHSVNKEIVFARVEKNKIDYVSFGRLRP
jgi:tRNA-intron endonuclease